MAGMAKQLLCDFQTGNVFANRVVTYVIKNANLYSIPNDADLIKSVLRTAIAVTEPQAIHHKSLCDTATSRTCGVF